MPSENSQHIVTLNISLKSSQSVHRWRYYVTHPASGWRYFLTALQLLLLLHSNGHFPDGSGLAGNRTSPFWILLERWMTDGRGGDSCRYKTGKAQSNSHHQQTNIQIFTGRIDALPIAQAIASEHCSYFLSCKTSLPLGQYQIILLWLCWIGVMKETVQLVKTLIVSTSRDSWTELHQCKKYARKTTECRQYMVSWRQFIMMLKIQTNKQHIVAVC